MGKRRKKKQGHKKGKWPKFGLVIILLTVFLALGDRFPKEMAETFSKAAAEAFQDGSGLEIHYLDVGQGDATLILCDGHAMLIDAGDNDQGTAVQSYLESQGVSTLDYVIGTHPDADHIGGLDLSLIHI